MLLGSFDKDFTIVWSLSARVLRIFESHGLRQWSIRLFQTVRLTSRVQFFATIDGAIITHKT